MVLLVTTHSQRLWAVDSVAIRHGRYFLDGELSKDTERQARTAGKVVAWRAKAQSVTPAHV